MSFAGRRCERHRSALLDFVDRREVRPSTGVALDHLARCADCARDLEITALAIVGLRRLYDEVAAIEPPLDAWDRLRSRIDRPATPAYSLRSPVLGTVLALSMVAAIGLRLVAVPGSYATNTEVGAPDTSRDRLEPKINPRSNSAEATTISLHRAAPDGEPVHGWDDSITNSVRPAVRA